MAPLRFLVLVLALLAPSAWAQCSECEKTFEVCSKTCKSKVACRSGCEKELRTCTQRCSSGRQGAVVVSQVETECSGGEAKACATLGALYFQGREVAQDFGKAEKYLQSSCRDGQADACGLLGEMYLRPAGVPQDVQRGLALMEKSCDRGSSEGCTALGRVLDEGKHKPKDPERALKLWREACEHSHAPACTELGNAHLLQKREPLVALEKYDRGCTLGAGPSCAAACNLLLGEHGIPRDEKRAYPSCDKGCVDGQFAACADQALLLWYADGVKADPKKGRELMDAACEGGDAAACMDLGEALENGTHGVKKNVEAGKSSLLRAARRFDKQCTDRMDPRSCARWAELVLRDRAPTKDVGRAQALLETACTAEETIGCASLGAVLVKAKETPRALEAYQRGCEANRGAACEGAGRLLEAEDKPKARAAYEKGCLNWSAGSCARLAELLKAEKAPAKEVKALRAKACRYGAPAACK